MGWDREKPTLTDAPVRPALTRWLFAAGLAFGMSMLLFALHAGNQLSGLQAFNIWGVSALPVLAWTLIFSVRAYIYGSTVEHSAFLQDEARYAQEQWQHWAGRYVAVQASGVVLPDHVCGKFLTRKPQSPPTYYDTVRRIDYLMSDKTLEYEAIASLLGTVESAVIALPEDIELRITVLTDSDPSDYARLRETLAHCWASAMPSQSIPANVSVLAALSYDTLDSWLKHANPAVELILVLQLRGKEEYSDGLAALLLTIDEVAKNRQLPVVGRLLRPMRLDIERAESDLVRFMDTQSQARTASGLLAESGQILTLTPIIIPIGEQFGARFTTDTLLVQESLTGVPGPFSAWLLAALGLDCVRHLGESYLMFSLIPQCEVVSTVCAGDRNEDV
ncbi:MAG: hypothetical protein ACOH2R_01690 [Pseudomonas sp.]